MPRPASPELWTAAVGGGRDWAELLSDEELDLAEGLPTDASRDRFACSRGVQRHIAGHYLRTDPRRVRFDRTCPRCGADHGRPRIVGAGLDYSVAHTERLVLIGVVHSGRIGVDLDRPPDRAVAARVASGTMTPNELDLLERTPPDERTAAFLRLWTRKEAAVKLSGLGLAAPLHRIDASGPLLAETPPETGLAQEPVYLLDLPIGTDHTAALATTSPVEDYTLRDAGESL